MIPASAIVRELMAAGVTGDALVAALERLEAAGKPERSAAAIRQARYRENKKAREADQSVTNVTGDITHNAPSPQVSPPSMVSPITPSLTTLPSSPPSHIRAVAGATRPAIDEDFQKFWEVYPKRDGANPKAPARKQFLAALKAGTEAGAIVGGAGEYARREAERIGTPYIAQAVTWLRQRRWEDYAAAPEPTTSAGWKPGMRTAEEILAELKEKQDGEAGKGMGLRLSERASVGQDGLRAREGDQGVVRDHAPQPGVRSLGSILSKTRLGSDRLSKTDEGGGEPGPSLDCASSVSRVAYGS